MSESPRIDLHAHTTHSDGTLSPEELATHAHEVGLTALAITDHDTTSALEPAARAAEDLGLEILPGCEISTRISAGTVHLLAFGFDVDDADFQALLTRVRELRDERNVEIFAKLAALGVPLETQDVMKYVVGRVVARPHFARAMVDKGYAEDTRDVFARFLKDGGPAYVPWESPDPREAIEVVRKAGGAPVIAHPRQIKLGSKGAYRRNFRRWKDAGLVGIEVDHPSHDATYRAQFRELADELDLVPTGGSDFHGAAKPWIRLGEGDGTIDVRRGTWDALMAACA